jgi:hypothetical protein
MIKSLGRKLAGSPVQKREEIRVKKFAELVFLFFSVFRGRRSLEPGHTYAFTRSHSMD